MLKQTQGYAGAPFFLLKLADKITLTANLDAPKWRFFERKAAVSIFKSAGFAISTCKRIRFDALQLF